MASVGVGGKCDNDITLSKSVAPRSVLPYPHCTMLAWVNQFVCEVPS